MACRIDIRSIGVAPSVLSARATLLRLLLIFSEPPCCCIEIWVFGVTISPNGVVG